MNKDGNFWTVWLIVCPDNLTFSGGRSMDANMSDMIILFGQTTDRYNTNVSILIDSYSCIISLSSRKHKGSRHQMLSENQAKKIINRNVMRKTVQQLNCYHDVKLAHAVEY